MAQDNHDVSFPPWQSWTHAISAGKHRMQAKYMAAFQQPFRRNRDRLVDRFALASFHADPSASCGQA